MSKAECVWEPKQWPSGRISTLFHSTDCGHEGTPQDGAKYCCFCGKPLELITQEEYKQWMAATMYDEEA